MGNRSKWQRHGIVLAVLAAIVGTIVACLFASARGTGLDGLGAVLAGIMLLCAFGLHALISTIFVAASVDHDSVALAPGKAPTGGARFDVTLPLRGPDASIG
jgi:hypothetical protein